MSNSTPQRPTEATMNIPQCSSCNAHLIFSAREIGDGLCHLCAHRKLATLTQANGELEEKLCSMVSRHAGELMRAKQAAEALAEAGRKLSAADPAKDIEKWFDAKRDFAAALSTFDAKG